MACFLPKRKTDTGTENVKISMAAIEGLQHELDDKASINECIPYYFIDGVSGTSTLATLRNAIIATTGILDSIQIKAIRLSYYPSRIFLMSLGEPFAGDSLMDISITDIGTLQSYRGVLSARLTINEFMNQYMPSLNTNSSFITGAINEINDKVNAVGMATIDKISNFSIETPEMCEEQIGFPAQVYIENDGISYNTMAEITVDNNDSETSYPFAMSTHTPLTAGNNITFARNDEGTAIVINSSPAMPLIRVANANSSNFNMIVSETDPLTFSVEILDGKLQVGDKLQICTRQLFTYKKKLKRKYKLRQVWCTDITDTNVNNKFLTVSIAEGCRDEGQRLFKTGAQNKDKNTLSALYFRIRRPTINSSGQEVGATFSNVVTVWKKYDRSMSKIFIK